MLSIQEELSDTFAQAISTAFPDVPDAPVVIALSGTNPKFGDYQCNSAMPIAGLLKSQGMLHLSKYIFLKLINNMFRYKDVATRYCQ